MGVFSDVTPVADHLVAPEVEDVELDVPPEWETADEIFQTIRDTTNQIIDALGHVGVDLPKLPDGDLAELLVEPFSGDYNRIRANGTACRQAGKGMRAMAKNVTVATADMGTHWSGRAAEAFSQQALAYSAVTVAASHVMDQGYRIFDAVADQVQNLAELAVKIIVRLARILVRLSKNIASRFAGWLAWVKLAADLATEGLDPIRDIYDDIRSTVEIVSVLFDLKDAIDAYVENIRQRFKHFLSLPDLVRDLPEVVDAPLATVLRTADQTRDWEKRQRQLEKQGEKREGELGEALDDADDTLGSTTDDADDAGRDTAE